jgi:hypothetical protein
MPEGVTNGGRRPSRTQLLIGAGVVAVAAVIVVVIVLVGGGSDDDGGNGASEVFTPNVVTDDEINAQEQGSPGRTLLEWWQSFQFGDPTQVIELTSHDTHHEIGENDKEELVSTRGQNLQGIEVLGTSEDGNTAYVRVGLLQFQPEEEGEPPPDEPTSSTPDSFAMQDEGGEWLFADTAYLEPQIESLKAAEQQQEQTTTGEENTEGG